MKKYFTVFQNNKEKNDDDDHNHHKSQQEEEEEKDHQDLHQCKQRTRWVIRFCIIFLASLLCFYQIYLVCVLYFTYPTTIDIRLDQSQYVHLPSVTVCSELASTVLIDELIKNSLLLSHSTGINLNYQQQQYHYFRTLFGGKTRSEINRLLSRTRNRQQLLSVLHSLPLNQQHRLTVSSSEFFRECHLPTSSAGGYLQPNTKIINGLPSSSTSSSFVNVIDCSRFGTIVETISYRYKCFSLFLQSPLESILDTSKYEIPQDVITNFKYLVWIKLNRDYIFNGIILIHPPDGKFLFCYNNKKNNTKYHQSI